MDSDKEEKGKGNALVGRLQHIIREVEDKRSARVEKVKAKTGRTDLPLEQRKLTQIEAAAYCGVSPATINRWTKAGLKTVPYGQKHRYLVKDLKQYMKTLLKGNMLILLNIFPHFAFVLFQVLTHLPDNNYERRITFIMNTKRNYFNDIV